MSDFYPGGQDLKFDVKSFMLDDDDRCYIKNPVMLGSPSCLPIFFKDTHKLGYIEIGLNLIGPSCVPVRNWLESGEFCMNVCNSNGEIVPVRLSHVEEDVSISFASIQKRGTSTKATDPIRTVLKYFDSRDVDLGGPMVPIIRFRVQKITDKLNLGAGQTSCRIKIWGTGRYATVPPCITPPFLVKSKNPKVRDGAPFFGNAPYITSTD
jgi:hypothetical protein